MSLSTGTSPAPENPIMRKNKNITVETYIQDGFALTEYLKERFSQKRFILWANPGAAPWGFSLFISILVLSRIYWHGANGGLCETERMDYAGFEIAQSKGDTALIKRLMANGTPPYYGKDVTWKSAAYLNYLSAYMANNPEIHNPGYNTLRDIGSEYGMLDKINFFRGIINTYNHVYQQLYTIDMRKDYTKLNVPVYFFLAGMT